jgi:excisionase family DNA binding protein
MISGTFYTLGETASKLGKNRRTIWLWLKKGQLEGRRIGNIVFIPEDEVNRLLAIKDITRSET